MVKRSADTFFANSVRETRSSTLCLFMYTLFVLFVFSDLNQSFIFGKKIGFLSRLFKASSESIKIITLHNIVVLCASFPVQSSGNFRLPAFLMFPSPFCNDNKKDNCLCLNLLFYVPRNNISPFLEENNVFTENMMFISVNNFTTLL